jgi:hypothetical protein
VLNNYALSRLLAHDPQGARDLASRIHNAGGQSNPKIARNLAMIADMAPAPKGDAAAPLTQTSKTADAAPKPAQSGFTVAGATPTPAKPAPTPANVQPQHKPVHTAAATDAPFVSLPVTPPASAPATKIQAPTPLPKVQASNAQPSPPTSAVMQKVPVDPLAGPVAPRKATRQPHALAKMDKTEAREPQAPENKEENKKEIRTAEQIRDSVPTLRLSANAY